MKPIIIVLMALLLSACGDYTQGTKVDQSKMSQFVVEKSTYQDVVNALGPPTSSTVQSNGDRIINYQYQSQQSAMATYVGAFSQKPIQMQSSCTTFVFHPDGRLKTFSSTDSNNGIGGLCSAGPFGK